MNTSEKHIEVHYVCRDMRGKILESTLEDGAPVPVEIGAGQLLPALEKVYLSMKPGETRRIVLEPEDAFGPRHKDLVGWMHVDELNLAEGESPERGMWLELEDEDGEVYPGIVVNIEDDCVQVDTNHPLAGKKLSYELIRVK